MWYLGFNWSVMSITTVPWGPSVGIDFMHILSMHKQQILPACKCEITKYAYMYKDKSGPWTTASGLQELHFFACFLLIKSFVNGAGMYGRFLCIALKCWSMGPLLLLTGNQFPCQYVFILTSTLQMWFKGWLSLGSYLQYSYKVTQLTTTIFFVSLCG